jgi:hypothetical protein
MAVLLLLDSAAAFEELSLVGLLSVLVAKFLVIIDGNSHRTAPPIQMAASSVVHGETRLLRFSPFAILLKGNIQPHHVMTADDDGSNLP